MSRRWKKLTIPKRANYGASEAGLQSIDSSVRHRCEPDNPAVKEILERPRDVHMSIDAALQMRVSEILSEHLAKLGKQKGAVVVMDPSTGDIWRQSVIPGPRRRSLHR